MSIRQHLVTLVRQRDWLAGQLQREDLAPHSARRISAQHEATIFALDHLGEVYPDDLEIVEADNRRIAAQYARGPQ